MSWTKNAKERQMSQEKSEEELLGSPVDTCPSSSVCLHLALSQCLTLQGFKNCLMVIILSDTRKKSQVALFIAGALGNHYSLAYIKYFKKIIPERLGDENHFS